MHKIIRSIHNAPPLALSDSTQALKDFRAIPGPKSYPLIGTLYKYLPFIGDYRADSLDKNAWLNWTRYGPLVRESLMPGVEILHVFDPADVEAVLRQDDRPERRSHLALAAYRRGKPGTYRTAGLLATNGGEWWRVRSAFQKNFSHPASARRHAAAAARVLADFALWVRSDALRGEGNVDLLPYLNRLNLELIGQIAFSERFNSFAPEEQEGSSRSSRVIAAAFDSNAGVFRLDTGVVWRALPTPLYRKMARSQEYLESVALDLFMKKAVLFDQAKDPTSNSLLDSFLEQKEVDRKDIVGMIVDILMAAIDTTSYSTSFALYHLATNPQVQDNMFKEVSSLLPTPASEITADVISEAVYTKCCLKESLRLNPVSIGVGRVLKKDMALKGYLVPKGTVIVTQNMVASRLQQHVHHPLVFRPERWRRAAEHEGLHPFLSIPFGFGPRACIARRLAEQNMHITLIKLIREFRVTWRGGELGVKTLLINKPDQPVCLKFTPREL